MTPEELLKPRYKVIADYPFSHYPVNTILIGKEYPIGEGFHFDTGFVPSNYPAIFSKLEWWEERDEKDMPKYLKDSLHEKIVIKVHKWFLKDASFISEANANIGYESHISNIWIPATEQEYLNYKNTQK